MEKILIMGAGIYQVPLIEVARSLGLYTIVASIPGNYPGFQHADKVYYVNTTDREGILQVAEQEQISGICTAGTDVAVATIGYVNGKLGLNGVSEEAAHRTSDKALMQDTFKEHGVSSAKHIKAGSVSKALEAAEEIGYPVVMKCVDSSGSRGISIVESPEAMESAFQEAIGYSRRSYALVEEKLKGTEIGVDGIVQGGKLQFIAPHNKSTYRSDDNVITAGHDFPYEGSELLKENIRKQTCAAIEAIGLDDCAINIDAFVDGDDVSIIEIGGRSGATCIPELITMCYGFDYYETILDLALGRELRDLPKSPVRDCRGRLIMSPVGGRISGIDKKGLDAIRSRGVEVSLDYGTGDPVDKMKNGTDRIGQVIAAVSGEEALKEIMKQVHRCISIDGRTLEELWNE